MMMRVAKGHENVFIDCGFSLAEAENLRIRSRMMQALIVHIRVKKLNRTKAAQMMGVPQPRISDLKRGKIGLFTVDTLVNMAASIGLKVDLDIRPVRARSKPKRVA
jgi:predicted XRE-type DNA-binding protein